MKKFLVALAICAATLSANTVSADLVLFIDDGAGTTRMVVDEKAIGLASSDGNVATAVEDAASAGIVGTVSSAGAIGVWTFTVSAAISHRVSDGRAELHLTVVGLSSAAGTLTVYASDDGYTQDLPTKFILQTGGVAGGPVGSSVTLDGYADDDDLEFAGSALAGDGDEAVASQGPFVGGFGGDSLTDIALTSGPYSMTLVTTIVHTGAGSSSADSRLITPEPSSCVLALIGLSFAAIAHRRRKVA